MIEIQSLSKTFGEGRRRRVAVRDVSFTASPGEIVCLLGRNGAGKTTTLRMLATLLTPSGGSARVAGHDIRSNPHEVRHHIGFHTGDTQLYGRLDGRETLAYFGRLYGLGPQDIRARTAHLAERYALHLDVPVGRLSTGHRQRLSLARALVHDPPVLILDEPTTGLDLLARGELLAHLEALRREGRTILFSTHQLGDVDKVADRIAVMEDARLLACEPRDVLCGHAGGLERAVTDLLTGAGAVR